MSLIFAITWKNLLAALDYRNAIETYHEMVYSLGEVHYVPLRHDALNRAARQLRKLPRLASNFSSSIPARHHRDIIDRINEN